MKTFPHTFHTHDLVGGHVVLDVINTVTARNAEPVNWLDSYHRALEWASLTHASDDATLAHLGELSTADPAQARRSLQRLVALREALHVVFVAAIDGKAAPDDSLRYLDVAWKQAAAQTRIRSSAGRARLELDLERSGLDYLSDALALWAVELLRALPVGRTRVCAGDQCGWLFIDSSKAGRRRWCDMATCGNAAKSRRFQARRRGANAKDLIRPSRAS